MDSIRPRNLIDYLQLAGRRKMLIIVPALIFTAASVVAIRRLHNVYQSSTFIIVDSPQNSGSTTQIDLPHRLATVKQQVTTRSNLVDLIQKYHLYPEQVNKNAPMDDIVSDMRTDIDVQVNSTRPDATDAFSISYKARDPQIAQQVTAELANQLIAYNVNTMSSEVAGEADVLDQRSRELSAQLHQMESQSPWLMNVKEDAPLYQAGGGGRVGPSMEAIRQHQMTVGGLNDKQYQLRQQISDIEQRISAQKKIVDQQRKAQTPADNSGYGALVAKRAELQGLRDNLINDQGLTDKHPKVVAINEQINAINNAIAELRKQQAGQVVQTPEERELQTLEMNRDQLKIELDVAGRELDRQQAAPPASQTIATGTPTGPPVPHDAASGRLAQDYLSLKKNYNDIQTRLQAAQLQAQTIGSGKVERFRILEKANLPEVPVWPNKRLLALLGAGLGLAIGIGVWLFVEMRKFGTFQDARDVEYYTALPLLAMIPTRYTAPERKKARMQRSIRFAAGLAFAVVATLALSKVLMITKLFELIGRK